MFLLGLCIFRQLNYGEFDNLHDRGFSKTYKTFNVDTLLNKGCTEPKLSILLETPCISENRFMETH